MSRRPKRPTTTPGVRPLRRAGAGVGRLAMGRASSGLTHALRPHVDNQDDTAALLPRRAQEAETPPGAAGAPETTRTSAIPGERVAQANDLGELLTRTEPRPPPARYALIRTPRDGRRQERERSNRPGPTRPAAEDRPPDPRRSSEPRTSTTRAPGGQPISSRLATNPAGGHRLKYPLALHDGSHRRALGAGGGAQAGADADLPHDQRGGETLSGGPAWD